jgi:hypothetical protein
MGHKSLIALRKSSLVLKCMTMPVPKEMKIETSNPVARLSDEQLALMIAALEERLTGENAKVIDAQAEAALPPPDQPAAAHGSASPRAIGLCPRIHA